MNRKSFMAELRSLLAFLDAAERDRVLSRYERMFDEAGAEEEAAVIRCFGSPVRQVLQIEREYREALASGETPFADGEASAETEKAEMPEETETAEEAYAAEPESTVEPEPENEDPLPEKTAEAEPEDPEHTAEEAAAADESEEPAFALLPELDLDSLELPELDVTVPTEEALQEPEKPEEPETAEAEEDEPEEVLAAQDMPENVGVTDDEFLAALLAEVEAEHLPNEEPDEPFLPAQETPLPEEQSQPPETAAEETKLQIDEAETPEEAEMPDETEDAPLPPAEETAEKMLPDLPAAEPVEEDTGAETYYEEAEERRPVSGGRAFAAVVVTIPMIAVWALLFGLSLGLGIVVLAIGAAIAVAGVYVAGYVFNGIIVRMPDLLLTAGTALVAFALALLLLWTGVSVAVAGCTLTVRLTRSIYRSILYPTKEENGDE